MYGHMIIGDTYVWSHDYRGQRAPAVITGAYICLIVSATHMTIRDTLLI